MSDKASDGSIRRDAISYVKKKCCGEGTNNTPIEYNPAWIESIGLGSIPRNPVVNDPELTGIDAILAERGNRYGEFSEHARITQNIKKAMIDSRNWDSLSDDKKECLEMLSHKIGRILNGDPAYIESYRDMIGYTQLVVNNLMKTEGATDGRVVLQEVRKGRLVDK